MHKQLLFSGISETNTLLIEALLRHGVRCIQIPDTNIILLQKGRHKELIVEGYSSLTAYSTGLIISNKFFCKQILLRHHIDTPLGQSFLPQSKRDALLYARTLGFPVMLKIENSQIDAKSVLISAEADFYTSFSLLAAHNQGIIVEQYIKGVELSCFVTSSGYLSVIKRGTRIDPLLEDRQQTQIYEDCTQEFYQFLLPIAKKILSILGDAKSIRFTCRITDSQRVVVLELYHSPSLHIEHALHKGDHVKDCADVLVELLFPSLL